MRENDDPGMPPWHIPAGKPTPLMNLLCWVLFVWVVWYFLTHGCSGK